MFTDCEKCWCTPCECGWDYRRLPLSKRIELASVVLGVKPEALSGVGAPEEHPMLKDGGAK